MSVPLRRRLYWADRIAVAVAILLASLFLFFWLFAFVIVGSLGAYHMLADWLASSRLQSC